MPKPADITFDVLELLEEIKENGICLVPGFWSEAQCAAARAEVDRVIEEYPEYVNKNAKADKRVYGANNASSLIADFGNDEVISQVATAYNCEESKTAFTLAAKMAVSEGNLGSGEGWHRDAFFRQFKAIIYLSDVGLNHGPFQMVKNSHLMPWVLSDMNTGMLGYMQYRMNDDEIGRILEDEPGRLVTYTAKAGTLILVDTSTIHRGKPIEKGTRYALTNYYFPNDRINSSLYEKFNVLPASL